MSKISDQAWQTIRLVLVVGAMTAPQLLVGTNNMADEGLKISAGVFQALLLYFVTGKSS